MTLTHRGYQQRELKRTGHAAWTITTVSYGPAVTSPAITSSAFIGSGTAQNYYYQATALDADTSEEPAKLALHRGWRDRCRNDGEYLSLSGTAPAGVNYVNIYKNLNGIYGFIGQAAVSGGTWGFQDDKIEPDTLDSPQSLRTPFSGSGNYPQACFCCRVQKAKEKASSGKLTFTKTVALEDPESDFKNTLQYEYYNSMRK